MNRGIQRSLRPFFAIWIGQAFSLLGSRAVQFALVWWLTQQTGSAMVLATATLVALIPEIVLSPIAGAYVDRWDRRIVMIVADGLIALATLWLAFLFWTDAVQVWHLYAIMFVRAVGGGFHWPAMQASTALMVPQEHLARVAGLNQTLNGFLSILGPPLGAFLMEVLSIHGVLLIDVGTAAFAILPLLFVHVPRPERDAATEKATSIWADIRAGGRYILNWPGLMALIGMAMVIKIALTPAFSLLPLLVKEHFHGDAAKLSLLQAIFGTGVVLGGIVLSLWGGFKRKIFTTMSGVALLASCLISLGLAPEGYVGVAVVSMFGMGVLIPFIDGPIMAIMQSTVAPGIQGRVFTLMGSLLTLTSPIGLAVAGPVSDGLGLQVWYVAAGVLSGVIGVAGFFVPAIVNIEENAHGATVPAQPLTATEAKA